jgi:phage virion morphogenesis protein
MLTIDFNDREIQTYLGRVAGRLENPRELLAEIGDELTDSTMRRFGTSTGPDGERWAPNTETTLALYLDGRGKSASASTKKPLVADGNLASTIAWQLDGADAVLIGSPQKYAGVQQEGATKGSLGGGAPWGDIPARPFLGVSDDDARTILDLVDDYLLP